LVVLLVLPIALAYPCVYYFYGDGCPHCSNVKSHLDEIESDYNVQIFRYETWDNPEKDLLFDEYMAEYGGVRKGVPTLFIGDDYLQGDSPIINGLETLLDKYQDMRCGDEPDAEPSVQERNPFVFIGLVAVTALVIFWLLKTKKL